MPSSFRTQRIFYAGAALLALIATVLRTLALTLSTDHASGYFIPGAVLPLVYRILAGLAAIALILFPALALKGRVPQKRAAGTRYSTCGAALCALLFFLNFITACTLQGSTTIPAPLRVISLFLLLAATVYFILQALLCRVSTTTLAVLGSLAIAALACLISLTYFDLGTPMNAPHKTDLHMALLAVMLYLLYELRALTDISLPRALTACSALAFFLATTVGFSDVIAYLAGVYNDPMYLAQDLLLIAAAIYIGARSAADAALSQPLTKGQETTV